MTVGDLINKLSAFDARTEITILDGFNGGGIPRTINFGPILFDPQDKERTFNGDEMQDYSDLDTPSGQKIIVMGYGSY
jgi:hypothetical protein